MPHADPAARQAYNRDYKRANRDRYRRRQKSYDAAKHANERAAAFGVEGTLTPEDVEQVLSVGACHWCGVALGYFTTVIDHVVALAKGGPNTPANLVPSCDPCNSRKADGTHPDRWAGDFEWAPLTATEPPCVMGDRYQLLPSDNGRAVYVERVGKKAAGRLLDGRTWDEIPGPVR